MATEICVVTGKPHVWHAMKSGQGGPTKEMCWHCLKDKPIPISPPLSEETEQKQLRSQIMRTLAELQDGATADGNEDIANIAEWLVAKVGPLLSQSPPGHQAPPEKQALAWIERQVLRRVGTVTIGLTEDGNIGVWGPLQFNESDLCIGSGDTVLDAILAALPPEQNPTAPPTATT